MFDANDPRWTAYILNELDPAELAVCESLLSADPAAGRAVAELRCTIDQLTTELQREPCPTLTVEQREVISTAQRAVIINGAPQPVTVAVASAASVSPAATPRPWYVEHAWKLATLAASLLLIASVFSHMLQTPGEQPDVTAMSEEIAQLRADLAQAKSQQLAIAISGLGTAAFQHDPTSGAFPTINQMPSLAPPVTWRGNGSYVNSDSSMLINGNHLSLPDLCYTVCKPTWEKQFNEGPWAYQVPVYGDDTIILSGANTYFGGTAINGGTLMVSNPAQTTTSLTIGSGGTMDVGGGNHTMNAKVVIANGIPISATGSSLTLAGGLDNSSGRAVMTTGSISGTGTSATGSGVRLSASQFNSSTLNETGYTLSASSGNVTLNGGLSSANSAMPSYSGAATLSTGGIVTSGNGQDRSSSNSTGSTLTLSGGTATVSGVIVPKPTPLADGRNDGYEVGKDFKNAGDFGSRFQMDIVGDASGNDQKGDAKGQTKGGAGTLQLLGANTTAGTIGGVIRDPNAKESQSSGLASAAYTITKSDGDQIQTNLLSRQPDPQNTARYDFVQDNKFLPAVDAPLSTFAIDVDTASYSNMRRFILKEQHLPPKAAVRIEEMVNYFHYDYAPPLSGDAQVSGTLGKVPDTLGDGKASGTPKVSGTLKTGQEAGSNERVPDTDPVPFAVHTEVASCPWNPEHRLVKIGLKGREMSREERPTSNFVFLLDVSGSMHPQDRLPMVIEAMKLLLSQLTENDRVAVVVYASEVGVKLPGTACDAKGKQKILDVLDKLMAGGSTSGGSGIRMAYETAEKNFIKGGTNRVILATDGDFNVGITNTEELLGLISEKANAGVSLTTLGVGNDNFNDAMMEKLADKGHGNYFYLDSMKEAKKVLVEQLTGTLHTIAKDVKIQIEFNPAEVVAYRQIGYENRVMAKEDFNNDKKLGGDIGAGHTVTALYEIVPAVHHEEDGPRPEVDALKYQKQIAVTDAAKSGELFTLKLRYKSPDADASKLIESSVKDEGKKYAAASSDFKFAASVAAFGMLLRDSPYKGNATLANVQELAQASLGSDVGGYRAEFVELLKQVERLTGAGK